MTPKPALRPSVLATATCLATCLAALNPAPASAAAEPAEGEVDQFEALAVAAYESGNFEEATRLFEQAYQATGDPNVLYNIGRVYEEAGDLEQAIEHYERFVRAQGVGLDTRLIASERLSQLKKIVGADEDASPPPAQPEPAASPTSDAPADNLTTPPQRSWMITGAVLAGVGAPVAIVGAVLGGLAIRNNNRLENEQLDDPESTQERGRQQALAADIMVPVGSVMAVAGASLLVVYAIRSSRFKRTAVAPDLGPDRAGLAVVGRF